MGFGATIEDGSGGRRESFFAFESGFETFFDESFAEMGDGLGVTVKLLGDIAVEHSTVSVFIDGKEDVGVVDLVGTALAFAEGCLRHRLGHDRFDYFLTFRTISAVDRMFGDFGRDVFGNVFDDSLAFLFSFVELGAAVGTVGESMFDVFVDDGGARREPL